MMDNTPLPQRTRTRRTERFAGQYGEQQEPLMQQPQQPSPVQETPAELPQNAPGAFATPGYMPPASQQQSRPQSQPRQSAPRYDMQQPVQPYPRQPSRPASPAPMQTLPPSQALYRQAMQQQRREQAAQPRYVPREDASARPHPSAHPTPRALQQGANTGWRTPTVDPRPVAAPDRAQQRVPVQEPEEPRREKKTSAIPGWLSTLLCLSLVCVMALVAGMWLIRAWLKTDLDRRIADYQAILNNYHVTENANGRSVTYQAWIERYAREYNLQPAFVTAIIRNESSFRTNAESSVGARGLMQMMPDTAEWIAGKLDDDSYSFDRMYDAETNIRYGCWYLGYLSSEFRGDPILIAAAFHAGQGNVRGWLGDRSISPDGLTIPIDKLPIAETRQYAGRVTQAYGIYQTLLYTPDAPPAVQLYDGRAAADRLLSAGR